MADIDYRDRYEDLLRENELLHNYIHEYQAELNKYSSRLCELDKCTEKDVYYENVELRKKQTRHDAIVASLWESIGWVAEDKAFSTKRLIKKTFGFISLSRVYHLILILAGDLSAAKRHHDKYGVDRTIKLIENMPLISSAFSNVCTELAKHCKGRDNEAALRYAALAWRKDPRPYRMKFLAFNVHRNGENEKALALLEALPANLFMSDSETRLLVKIRNLYERDSNSPHN